MFTTAGGAGAPAATVSPTGMAAVKVAAGMERLRHPKAEVDRKATVAPDERWTVAAGLLGLSATQVVEALRSGQSIADLNTTTDVQLDELRRVAAPGMLVDLHL